MAAARAAALQLTDTAGPRVVLDAAASAGRSTESHLIQFRACTKKPESSSSILSISR